MTVYISRHTLRDTTPEPAPHKAIDPFVGDLGALTRSPGFRAASQADLAPQPMRPGSEDALACPSRINNHLHHRNGRVTDLNGTLLTDRHGCLL